MQPRDASFGAGFDAAKFRAGVLGAMQMGAPPDAIRRATFIFPPGARRYERDGVPLTVPPRLDRDGRPFDPHIAVITEPGREVVVDCAIEMTLAVRSADGEEGPVGAFRHTRVNVTLLDAEYQLVKGCKELRYNGDVYLYGYEPQGLGLFGVGVHTMIFYARDET